MKMKAWKSPFKGIFSSAFALWANAGVFILLPSLTYFLNYSGKKLKISVNIVARTLKFGM